MNKNIKVAVYLRIVTFEQVDDRTSQMKEFTDKNGYKISDFIVEQRNGLAACSKTLYGLLHNQSVKTIFTPTLAVGYNKPRTLQRIFKKYEGLIHSSSVNCL